MAPSTGAPSAVQGFIFIVDASFAATSEKPNPSGSAAAGAQLAEGTVLGYNALGDAHARSQALGGSFWRKQLERLIRIKARQPVRRRHGSRFVGARRLESDRNVDPELSVVGGHRPLGRNAKVRGEAQRSVAKAALVGNLLDQLATGKLACLFDLAVGDRVALHPVALVPDMPSSIRRMSRSWSRPVRSTS